MASIMSMTGFGGADFADGAAACRLEVAVLNGRYLQTLFRLPDDLARLEVELEGAIRRRLERGTVKVTLRRLPGPSGPGVPPELAGFVDRLRATANALGLGHPDNVVEVLDLFRQAVPTVPPAGSDPDALAGALDDCLGQIETMRRREGESMRDEMLALLASIETRTAEIEALSSENLAAAGRALSTRVARLSGEGLDPRVLHQEAVLLAARADVNEELVRLRSHLAAMRRTLADGSPAGRRLSFLCQELNREANTIGSKAALVEISAASVAVKESIERLRELAQNVL